jgi:hypothetical protein
MELIVPIESTFFELLFKIESATGKVYKFHSQVLEH